MKKLLLLTALLIGNAIFLAAQEADKKAIIKLIEDEHLWHCQKDYEKVASTFDHGENVIHGNGVDDYRVGWSTLSEAYKAYYLKNPEPTEPAEFYDYEIAFNKNGNKAWATFYSREKGQKSPRGKEMRGVKKIEGEWKITSVLYIFF